MKKIVSAVAIAAMAAGFATAEVKVTFNYRARGAIYETQTTNTGAKDAKDVTVSDWMDLNNAGYAIGSDTLKFAGSGENCGATFSVNFLNDVKESNSGKLLTLNELNGWMSWDVGPGKLKLAAGNWKDGFLDGSYRVKKDVDAQNAEGLDFERFKLGSILKGNNAVFVDDLSGSNGAVLGYAEYAFPVNDDVKLNILAGAVENAFDTVVDGEETTNFKAKPVVRASVSVADLLNAEVIWKKAKPQANTFALFVKPTALKELDATVGFTMDTYGKDGADYSDMAFDLRARYQVSPELSITTMNNITMTDLDAGRVVNAGIAGVDGKQGWATKAKVKTAMWNNLSARYKVNSVLTATLNVGLLSALSTIDGDDTDYGMEWRVTPAVQVYASSAASVWTGVAISGATADDAKVSSIQVPFVFRVKM